MRLLLRQHRHQQPSRQRDRQPQHPPNQCHGQRDSCSDARGEEKSHRLPRSRRTQAAQRVAVETEGLRRPCLRSDQRSLKKYGKPEIGRGNHTRRKPAKPAAPKPRTWKDEVRAQNGARRAAMRGTWDRTKPSYYCGRKSGLDFGASRLENAAAHDRRTQPQFARRAGQGGFRHHPSAKVDQPAPRKPRLGLGPRICRPQPAAERVMTTGTNKTSKAP